jgi:hypothetical protein
MALCRSAGFARVELLNVKHRHARLVCYRHWETAPENPAAKAPELAGAVSGRCADYGINFNTAKEEFVTCWFNSNEPDLLKEDLRPEVSGFGAPAIAVEKYEGTAWHVSFRLPPGLAPGWHEVRLCTVRSGFSNACRIAVDIPLEVGDFAIVSVCDSRNWCASEVHLIGGEESGFLTLWVRGLAGTADRNNLRLYCEGSRIPVDFISPGSDVRQVNVRLPASLAGRLVELTARHGEK